MFDKFYAQLLAFTHTRTRTHARSSLCRSKITSSFSPLRRASPGGAVLGKKKKKKLFFLFSLHQGFRQKKHTPPPALSSSTEDPHAHTHREHARAHSTHFQHRTRTTTTINQSKKWESYFQFPAKSRRLWSIRTSSSTSATRTCAATTTWNE